MTNKDQKKIKRRENLLSIRSEGALPRHKVEITLDDLDRDILEMHQKDVFFSYTQLAEKWSVTDATIRNRIKRLKALGVMDVILVMNPYKIGFSTFAIIGIRLEREADLDKVAEELLSIPGVNNLVMVAGRYDFFVNYVCKNMEEYRQFIENQLRKIFGISQVESFLGLELYERTFELGIIG
jgi:Lrp/AsnC family transcriptional regulator for asnA, asnC and gidA